jgi:hypothetical protein
MMSWIRSWLLLVALVAPTSLLLGVPNIAYGAEDETALPADAKQAEESAAGANREAWAQEEASALEEPEEPASIV